MSIKRNEADRADSIKNETKDSEKGAKSFNTSKLQVVEMYFDNKYQFRFNSIKCKPEIKNTAENQKKFTPVDKYILNSLKRELDACNTKVSTADIKDLIESDYSPKVNPITDYFKNLKSPDPGSNFIKELASTVSVANFEMWEQYLTRWLVAVIANAMNEQGCQNHTCLVLTGGQGKFKTTWLDNLCPKDLQNYIFTGKIDPNNKDSLTYIAEFLFINIDDQLRQLNKKDENELKNLITAPSVKYRRPYDPYIMEYPHTASFMASVNGNDFLTDPTGSRRFLPFEVLNIDIKKAKSINMDLVYSQAMKLYKDGYRYFFNDEEIESLNENNKKFQVNTAEEQLISTYYKVPITREQSTHFLKAAVIQARIEKTTHAKLNLKKTGEALIRLGFERWQRTVNRQTEWVYSVIEKTFEEIDQESKLNTEKEEIF